METQRRNPGWRAGLLLPACITLALGSNTDQLPHVECVRLVREARIAKMNGDVATSLALLEQAAREYPDEITPVLELVRHHQAHDTGSEELGRLRTVLTQRLADPESPVPWGTLRFLVLNPDATEEELQLALSAVAARLSSQPDDYDLLEAMSILQERLQLTTDAHATIRRMLVLDAHPLLVWRCVALDRLEENWSEAAGHLAELLEKHPEPLLRMAYIELLGKVGDAEEIARQLELLDTDSGIAPQLFLQNLEALLFQVAWDLQDQGQSDTAEKLFRRIVELDPDNRAARRTIIHLYSGAEERIAHEEELEQRLAGDVDPELLLEEGVSRLASHDFAGAFELLGRAANALPDSEPAWFNLGLAAIRMEQWENAADALARAIDLNPDRAETWLNRGIALHHLERYSDAVPLLEGALEREPALTQSHYYLYVCYRSLGDGTLAVHHLAAYKEATGN